jgi:hypothetical protein
MIRNLANGLWAEQKGERGSAIAERKPFIGNIKQDEELNKLLESSRKVKLTDEELREQRISFAYGNAPANAKNITKDSVRKASQHILLKA